MEATSDQEAITVVIRTRPLNKGENGGGLALRSDTKLNRIECSNGQTYDFDKVYNEDIQTADIYTESASNSVKNVMSGINSTIFACKKYELDYIVV
jgi:hypothetical protein